MSLIFSSIFFSNFSIYFSSVFSETGDECIAGDAKLVVLTTVGVDAIPSFYLIP